MPKVEIEGEPLVVLKLTIPEARILMTYLQNPLISPKTPEESSRALNEELAEFSDIRNSIFTSLFSIFKKIGNRGFSPLKLRPLP